MQVMSLQYVFKTLLNTFISAKESLFSMNKQAMSELAVPKVFSGIFAGWGESQVNLRS